MSDNSASTTRWTVALSGTADIAGHALGVGSHVALITEHADAEESTRHQIQLAAAGIYRLGHYSFDQHRGFVAELLEQARRERESYWPGSPR
jgi:hypothetical protein